MKLLIDEGCNINSTDRLKRNPLFLAVEKGIHFFLENIFASIIPNILNEFRFILLQFPTLGHENIVNLLIEKGCDLNAKDYNGNDPLSFAIITGIS